MGQSTNISCGNICMFVCINVYVLPAKKGFFYYEYWNILNIEGKFNQERVEKNGESSWEWCYKIHHQK